MFFLVQLADKSILHDREFFFGIGNLMIAARRDDDAAREIVGIGAECDQAAR